MPAEKSIYDPNPAISQNAYISSFEEYQKFYQESLDNPAEFWSRVAKQFHWETPADQDKFLKYNFNISKGPISIKWMEGASTNLCYNLLDRNVRNGLGDQIAYYWWVPLQILAHFRSGWRRSHENKSIWLAAQDYWFFAWLRNSRLVT